MTVYPWLALTFDITYLPEHPFCYTIYHEIANLLNMDNSPSTQTPKIRFEQEEFMSNIEIDESKFNYTQHSSFEEACLMKNVYDI